MGAKGPVFLARPSAGFGTAAAAALWSFYILKTFYLLGRRSDASPPRPGETGAFFSGAERGSTFSAPSMARD
jgi:hypothetical protein